MTTDTSTTTSTTKKQAGLLGVGQAQQDSALGGVLAASTDETKREETNKKLEAQKTANGMSGAATGAMIGAEAYGPVGAVVGGAIGFITGELM